MGCHSRHPLVLSFKSLSFFFFLIFNWNCIHFFPTLSLSGLEEDKPPTATGVLINSAVEAHGPFPSYATDDGPCASCPTRGSLPVLGLSMTADGRLIKIRSDANSPSCPAPLSLSDFNDVKMSARPADRGEQIFDCGVR